MWEVPSGVGATQLLPGPNLHFIFTRYGDYFLYEKSRYSTLNVWSLVWLSRLYSTDSKLLLEPKLGRLVVSLKGPRYVTRKTRMGCSLAGTLEKRVWWVVLPATGYRGPGIKVTSDESAQEEVHEGHCGVRLQLYARAEQYVGASGRLAEWSGINEKKCFKNHLSSQIWGRKFP